MFIDPHVHCRDGSQAHKETIAHALSVAERAGFTAIFDMPNTDPPVTTKERVLERLLLAERANSPVFYGTYMGLTSDTEQIKRAVQTFNEFRQVVGFKLYAGPSVGNLGVVQQDKQRGVYRTLVEEGYTGVFTLHCENERLFREKLWNPKDPITHAYARPPRAEIESVRTQIQLAKEAGFEGVLHIAHVSLPETVKIANAAEGIQVHCGVCPHHLLLDYNAMNGPDGLLLKMNPPLREPSMRAELLRLLKAGEISWIETDHAPHTLEEKTGPPHMSGIPNLHKYPNFIRWLETQGFTKEEIKQLTYDNIADAFGLNDFLEPRKCVPQINLESEYPFDPYKGII